MSALYQKRPRRREINLVPLIDVLVMLVFTSFITMQFKHPTTLNLTLPKVETAGKSELKQVITISLSKEGAVDLDGQHATMENLAELIHKMNPPKDIPVVIRSDENTPLRFVTEAMDACRKHGLNKIHLQAR